MVNGASFHGRIAVVVAVLALHLALPSAQGGSGQAAKVDEFFQQWNSTGSPGAAVLVIDQGRTVLARGYGMANLEHGVPIKPDTIFDIASVSKQFAGMAIALLEADGKLSLNDDVRKYISELHDFGTTITIRHLVHHTSGIRDWPGTMSIGGWSYEDVMSFGQILRMAYHQRELNFTPGDVHAYSNTGYNLLAEVVARVSGKSFRQFCDERIFKPLGMTKTHFHDDHAEIVPNRAESYRPSAGGTFRHVPSHLTAIGSSSLFTTIEDMAKWIANFHAASPSVGGKAVITRMHERGRLNSGASIPYAFGQSVGEYRGATTVSHTGSWAGYRSVLQRFPDQEFAVVILANTSNMNPSLIARQIVDVYLGNRLGPAATTPGAGPPGTTLAPTWQPSAEELRTFAGEYYSAELQTSYMLEVRNGELVARHFRTGEFRLRPTQDATFQASGLGQVQFTRDSAGRVQSMTFYSDRVRNLRFIKITR